MKIPYQSTILSLLKVIIEDFLDNKVDRECPQCGRMLNLPDEEDIEKWLKGEK